MQELERQVGLYWRLRPSKEDGYQKNYWIQTREGDEIQIDFSYTRDMVKITLTSERENGRQYTTIIKSGTIIREKDLSTGRGFDLTSKFHPHAGLFGMLSDMPLLKAIGGNYGLPNEPIYNRRRPYFRAYKRLQRMHPWARLRNYLEEKRRLELSDEVWYRRLWRRIPAELGDMSLAGALFWAYSQHFINISEFAAACGFLGIFTGAMDWLIRQRNPLILKVAFFMALSAGAVYTEVQYRIWGIFL